jgi:hypothetical protein
LEPPRAGKSSRRRSLFGPVAGRDEEGRPLAEREEDEEDGREADDEERPVEGRDDGRAELSRGFLSSIFVLLYLNLIKLNTLKTG